jgi:uncharacterized protein (TIGR00297 family)
MIVNHAAKRKRHGGWKKAIPEGRDRMQSELLTGAMGMLLVAKAVAEIAALHQARLHPFLVRGFPSESGSIHGYLAMPLWFWIACAVSAGFALAVWLLRSATGPAAAMGGLVSLHVLLRQEFGGGWQETAMPSLLALFVLTFAATRFGRARKEAAGLAEPRRGRRAAQVLANLGAAGLLAAGGTSIPGAAIAGAAGPFLARSGTAAFMLAACIAALAEATADTVSSEMGQALGGRTLLITTGRVVAAGTDGGVSIAGTACGAFAAAAVVAVSPLAHEPVAAMAVFAAACAGLVFDSVLGATVERRGWIGNDLVNLSSTVLAAAVAWWMMAAM